MRATAPITAVLALAVLSLSPSLYARPKNTVHKTRVQAAAPAAPSKKNPKAKISPKAEAKPKGKHRRKHHEVMDDAVPVTIVRVHGKNRRHAVPKVSKASSEIGRKASSSDFLQAATPAAAAPEASPQAVVSGENSNHPSAEKSVSVLSVIRPAAQRPDLPTVAEAASTPVLLPSLYNKRGRLIVPPPMKGSHEILLRQNQVADRDGLDRIRDDEDIIELRGQRLLVALPVSDTLVVDERLPANRRYCRPWTAQFLTVMARAYYTQFHTPLQVNSAVRTVEFQQRLLRTNGNAAPAEGDTASPHLTGQAVDLAKHGLTLTQIAWMRGYLLPLVQEGKVDVEEEFQQACFHISVYKKYLPPAPMPPRDLMTAHRSGTTSLATAVH
ncbi:DUF5715 family protein [Granulicella sp. dw_53]|uniref:DUF5715 family protein n=1 Tax=Granulicella sp. dw_53 TaxID=2719792 RepID=UPI001BD36E5D|nr:DUF5715 family protein [Granulicella sp. dw_53]